MQTLISNFQQFLENIPLFNLISLLLAILGILLAIYFYLRGKRRRIPIYAVRSINLVEDSIGKIGEVEISYAESKVKNLSIARVALWNRGEETISNDDVARANPIKIICSGSTSFLGFEIVYQKNSANNFSIPPVSNPQDPARHLQNELQINFDYFDKNEGIIVQIFHTGKTGEEIKIEGAIKGADSIRKLGNPLFNKIRPISSYFEKMKRRHRKWILGLLFTLTPVIGFVAEFIPTPKYESPLLIKSIPFIFIAILYWSMALSVLRRRIPKGFELFEEELRP